MPSKPIELPPAVAKAFIRDMRAFFKAGGTGVRADAIAAQQLHALKQHYNGKLKLTDVKEMFLQMRDQVTRSLVMGNHERVAGVTAMALACRVALNLLLCA
jgi:hypothetical protein